MLFTLLISKLSTIKVNWDFIIKYFLNSLLIQVKQRFKVSLTQVEINIPVAKPCNNYDDDDEDDDKSSDDSDHP